jgi:hypothetical protein
MLIIRWNKKSILDNYRRCENCLIYDKKEKYKCCSKCKLCWYCSIRCQKKDWKNNHKLRCEVELLKLPSKYRLEYRNLYNALLTKVYERNENNLNSSLIFNENIKYWNVIDDPDDDINKFLLISSNNENYLEFCEKTKMILNKENTNNHNLIIFGYCFILYFNK